MKVNKNAIEKENGRKNEMRKTTIFLIFVALFTLGWLANDQWIHHKIEKLWEKNQHEIRIRGDVYYVYPFELYLNEKK